MLPYRFYRSVKSPLDDIEYVIEVDFVSEPDVVCAGIMIAWDR